MELTLRSFTKLVQLIVVFSCFTLGLCLLKRHAESVARLPHPAFYIGVFCWSSPVKVDTHTAVQTDDHFLQRIAVMKLVLA